MLQNGEADIYTAAKKIPEREEEFAFSRHPAITAFTSMNVETPNWRSDLYNKYYGSVEVNTDYTAEEKALLSPAERERRRDPRRDESGRKSILVV